MGNGYYAEKLSYKDWFEHGLAQRVHVNFIEQLLIVCFLVLVAGLKHPTEAAILGLTYSFGRLVYAIGYSRKVESRGVGVLLLTLPLFGLFYFSFVDMLALQSAAKA